jgi:hypothetical protein
MNANKSSRLRRILRRAREIWQELDYAQARGLELQTGVSGLTDRIVRRRERIRVRELESHLYGYETSD